MDLPTSSDGGHWDRPWTTQEMRDHRDQWSLACDVGLFRHLQKFSEDLTVKVQRTQSSLDSLIEDLKDSSIMIDNVTNVSLALANTQFIESRVYEDETPEKPLENPLGPSNPPDIDMISVVSESIKQSLEVMDSKYERVEMEASSESEDETEMMTPNVILKPQDPYQSRPLPYIIGSDKWRSSVKIGLESSSSESEIAEEEDENSESSEELPAPPRAFPSNRITRSRSSRSTSSTSSSEYNEKSNNTNSRTDKIYTRSQDTLNSTSEIETPTIGASNTCRKAPSFAEELAKRLGNVLPAQKPPQEEVRDPDQSSINRSKDDLFGSDNETDSVFTTKSDSLLNDHGGLFDEASKGLWKEKPAPKPTMIPPSLDVPPPINSIDTKPKSAIDDLFGDNESDDSDDIFAPRNSKFISKSDVTEGFQSHVNKVKGQDDNVMTSTPESNNNIPNLFEDDEEDSSLFSPIENIKNKSPEAIRSAARKPPGILVNQADLLSSALGSRLFNRTRSDFSDSSENESVETEKDTGESVNVNGNQSTASAVNTSESMVAGNLHRGEGNEITTDSSGISVPATSVNSTSGMSLRFEEPQMESTRLLSEEIYRERVPSDSLFHPSSHQSDTTENSIADSHMIHNQAHHQTRNQTTRHDDIFDNDDVFGPPPLPKANSKSKSKVNSLFDDSDSGDDLFSNTSSGSRSQKSAEQAASQYVEKPKINVSARGGSLFDADVDVFLNPSVPDIDIFAESGTCQKSKIDQPLEAASEGANATSKIFTKRSHLFDDEDDEDLFGVSRAGRMVDTNEDKSLTASKEDVKKDSDVVKSGDVGGKEEGKSGHVESRNLFGDADEEDDDSLFGQKSDIKSPPVVGEGPSTTDGPVGSKQKITGEGTKIEPPKSLRIRLPVPGEDSGQAPRRAVSGKIANLMGKMGDLKILSPTDTPPVMRRGEERQDSGQATPDKDSEDGGGFSVPKTPTSPSAPKDFASKESSLSPSVLDTESAVSFDVPAQVETLSIASKSRARIPAKRRPQSRQARQSALRHSGIDFDSPDTADGPLPDPESPTNPEEAPLDRLSSQPDVKVLKPPATLLPDDKSELSLGKESSLSITKNTLLSPSTDEEDLFDVPPDLPEDPQKDTLFSRAPILSPVSRLDDPERLRQELKKADEEQMNEKSEEPSDPLRDSHHDPLKDPSQLFAFVTKTPSPDKSKDELTADPDDSLFTQVSKKTDSEWKKPIDLFADDDSSGDLFSGPFTKPAPKKLVKETKGSLFEDVNSDDDNAVDDLFGSTSTKKSDSKTEASEVNNLGGLSPKGSTPGEEDDEDDEELFFDASEKPTDANKEETLFPSTSRIQKTKLEDIFGDTSNGDDDIFSTKTFTGSNYSDSSDIFSKRGGENPQEGGAVVKKSVTRDLKKTAEKIVEDPLSMFRDE